MHTWENFCKWFENKFHFQPEMTNIFFLIGVQELKKGYKDFSRKEKLELIRLGKCKILSIMGYLEHTGFDNEKWPVWEKKSNFTELEKHNEQKILKKGILAYFEKQGLPGNNKQ